MLISLKLMKCGLLTGFAVGAGAGLAAAVAGKTLTDPECRERLTRMMGRRSEPQGSEETV